MSVPVTVVPAAVLPPFLGSDPNSTRPRPPAPRELLPPGVSPVVHATDAPLLSDQVCRSVVTPAVATSLPTLEGILADDAFGVDPPTQPEVADGNPRPDLAAAVLSELRACNMGLACYLAHEGLRLSSLQTYRGLIRLEAAMRDVPAEPAQRLPVLRAHVAAAGVDPGFLDRPDYGIPASFGRVKFAFNEDVSALRTVLAAVDQFVTLADGPLPSPFMTYSPQPVFRGSRRLACWASPLEGCHRQVG